jgi:hypothetical protein
MSSPPALLDEVIEAHGGRRRWGETKGITAHVRSGGALFRSRWTARRVADFEITVNTRDQGATLVPFPKAGFTGVFGPDLVEVLNDGASVSARERPREAFFGLPGLRRDLWWGELDALYFAGYAMWNYLNTPFMFEWPGFEVSEGEPIEADGEHWRCLEVRFPDGINTHSREQSFYFDSRGLLRRHDYTARVVSRFANGAHFCDRHREFDGIVLPTRRRVLPRGPRKRPLPGPTVVWIELDSLSASAAGE